MQSHVYEIPSEEGEAHYRLLCSDFHLGSPYVDEPRIDADFAAARRVNARIWINGDLYDAIGPGDRRFTASALRRDLQHESDLTEALVEVGFRKLEPVADLIDWIGLGNHEEAWIKYRLVDMTQQLILRLNAHLERQKSKHRIRHGGISGYVLSKFQVRQPGTGRGPTAIHRTLYQHGSGGDSPVTKGSIDSYRRGNSFEFDCLTFGHKHNATVFRDTVLYVTNGGQIRQRDRMTIQTASYLRNIVKTGQKRPLDYSYAESHHHPPKPLGGSFLVLTPERETCERVGKAATTLWSVRQTALTGLVPLAAPSPAPAAAPASPRRGAARQTARTKGGAR